MPDRIDIPALRELHRDWTAEVHALPPGHHPGLTARFIEVRDRAVEALPGLLAALDAAERERDRQRQRADRLAEAYVQATGCEYDDDPMGVGDRA